MWIWDNDIRAAKREQKREERAAKHLPPNRCCPECGLHKPDLKDWVIRMGLCKACRRRTTPKKPRVKRHKPDFKPGIRR